LGLPLDRVILYDPDVRKLVIRLTLLLVCAAMMYACRESTQVTIRLTTDASCGGDGFQQAAIAVAAKEKLSGREPSALTEACQDGDPESDIGTIVVVPSGDDDAPFAVRVVAGIGVPAEACMAPDYVLGDDDTEAGRGCIVARRNLAFLPHTELELPIVLRKECLNVDCSADQTCVSGTCVSAKVDPDKCNEPGGCTEDDLRGGSGGVGGGGAGGFGATGGLGGAGGIGGTGGSGQVTALTIGESFSCALVGTTPYCWGLNESGAWGTGSQPGTATGPTEAMTGEPLPGLVVELAAGAAHLCVLTDNGSVLCAGDNTFGQLGTAGASSTSPTVAVAKFAQHVGAGARHTCARLVGGQPQVTCWGANESGQVTLPPTLTAGPSQQLGDAERISGGVRHTCVVEAAGTVSCWGDSTYFQVGTGNSAPVPPTTIQLQAGAGDLQATSVSAGDTHSCAIDTGGGVLCWGVETNLTQPFGNGPAVVSGDPTAAPNNVIQAEVISTGSNATCVVQQGGLLRCWGVFAGGLDISGSGNANAVQPSPVEIQVENDVVDVAVGADHACYLDELGQVFCWGNNSKGQVIGSGSGVVFPPEQIPLP